MNKMFSFMVGAFCGAIVGATTALLLTPASGQDLRQEMTNRWEEALAEAKQAMEETRQELQTQFEQMQKGSYQEE
ncbi:MAG TPA: YtxH domain-containing protein [candidate division Zixibacteria bacterium]|nr:YtxH domain-containing protein [candidate division Zixibacteria bacterium]